MYGNKLNTDGFFRNGQEGKAGAGGIYENPWTSSAPEYGLPTSTFNWQPSSSAGTTTGTSTGLQATADGGATQTGGGQDWGSILSGSANVISSIGGVIGLFTGGNSANQNGTSVFDQYSDDGTPPPPPPKKSKVGLIVLLVVVAVVIGGVIWYISKKKK
jgi:hypothetical protein